MKRIALLLLYVMMAVVTYGQSKEAFALVKVFDRGDKITTTIDFGDGNPVMTFVNEKEKMRVFETEMEPINLLIKNGWEIEKFSSLLRGTYTITFWVMKKRINKESEIKEGIKIKKTN